MMDIDKLINYLERKTADTAELQAASAVIQLRAELTEAQKQRDELLTAAEAIEINAEECMDFDECTAMLVSIDDYHKLMEAVASVKGGA